MATLTFLDALFLRVETPEMSAHIGGLQIYSLPAGEGSAWLQSMLESLREQPPGAPFNLRLADSGSSRLVVDDQFEIDYHVRHVVLPRPGDDRQLHAELARLHSTLLDRDRPLWEFHLIEGLADRRFAFYIKIHHALCDGATFSKWMAESTSISPSAPTPPIWHRMTRGQDSSPRPLSEAIRSPIALLNDVRDVSSGLMRFSRRFLRQRFLEGDRRLALPFSGPHTALNAAATASRNLACASFPLEELKAMGRPYRATLNDVVLALCDAALRRYLSEQEQEPQKPLVAAVPVNLRKPGEQGEGNLVTSLNVKLGHAGQSPAERLQTVSDSMRASRELFTGISPPVTQTVGFGLALIGAVGSALKLEGVLPPPLNLIISNVPGPREVRYFRGARLEEIYPISGIAPMTALNVTVYSYNGTLFFGLVSARRALPQLHDLKLCLQEVYEEFRQDLLSTGEAPAAS